MNLYTTDIVSLQHVLATYCGHLLAGVFEGYITKNIKMLYSIIWMIPCSNSENITNKCIQIYVNLYITDIVSLQHVLATYCGHLLAYVFEGYITKNIKMLYSIFWMIPGDLNFMCRHFRTLCSMFVGGVCRKNNWDEMARVFIQVKV